MLTRITRPGLQHPRRTALLALLFVLVAAAIGGTAASKLNAPNAFENPSSQAALARTQIERATGAEPTAGVIALVHSTPLGAGAKSTAATLRRDPGIAHVTSYANTHDPALISRDGRYTLITASLRSNADPNVVVDRLTKDFAARRDVRLGGADVSLRQTNLQATKDLGFAELLAFPLLALLAFMIFRGVAALLPLGVGITSVLGSLVALRAINAGLPLSSFALNVVTGLGLGLSIDYSLILVSRFREELAHGRDIPTAITTTFQTAGRTVIFSALTVAAAMASLTVFPLRFLQSIGIGGAVVALTAALDLTDAPARAVRPARRAAGQSQADTRRAGILVPARPWRHAPPRHHRHRHDHRPCAPRRPDPQHQMDRRRRISPADHPKLTRRLRHHRPRLSQPLTARRRSSRSPPQRPPDPSSPPTPTGSPGSPA